MAAENARVPDSGSTPQPGRARRLPGPGLALLLGLAVALGTAGGPPAAGNDATGVPIVLTPLPDQDAHGASTAPSGRSGTQAGPGPVAGRKAGAAAALRHPC